MMMAHDAGQNPPSRLDGDTVDRLRSALRAYLASPDEPAGLRSALARMATDARARTVLPEQLLVVLKDVWGSLPEVRAMTDSSEQVRLLQRVVTMCIKEYYSG